MFEPWWHGAIGDSLSDGCKGTKIRVAVFGSQLWLPKGKVFEHSPIGPAAVPRWTCFRAWQSAGWLMTEGAVWEDLVWQCWDWWAVLEGAVLHTWPDSWHSLCHWEWLGNTGACRVAVVFVSCNLGLVGEVLSGGLCMVVPFGLC